MRRHLAGVVLAAMGLVLIVFLVPLVVLVQRDAEHQAMAMATERAEAIAALGGSLATRSLPATPVDGFATSVFLPDGRVLGIPAERTPAVEKAARCEPVRGKAQSGVEALVPVPGVAGCPSVVRVLATDQALRGESTRLLVLLFTLSAGLLLIGVLLAERLAKGLIGSVRDLAAVADRMAAGQLDARVTPDGPGEIRRVGAQLNRLAIRVDHLVDEQRRHAADLAHRMRTPLTSLRLDIDALPPAHAPRLVHGYEAVVRALDELIRAARRTASQGQGARSDLTVVVRQRVAFWSVLAEDTGRTIGSDLPPGPVFVGADPKTLAAMLDALLGNIFAHTPDGVPMRLAVRLAAGEVTLTVDDGGPGFPDPGVIQRGRSHGASTGLGLDIARRTAEESGGRMRLARSPLGGARVELVLGGGEGGAGRRKRPYRWLNR